MIQRDSRNALIKAVNYLMELSEQEREQMGMKAEETVIRLQPEEIYKLIIEYYLNVIDKFAKKGRLLK